jgi:hypothetical protein
MNTIFVMVKSVVPMVPHRVSDLIYVENAHYPIIFALADALEDDKSTFEA